MVKDKTLAHSFGAWRLNSESALAREIYWALQTVSIKCRLQTAECRLLTDVRHIELKILMKQNRVFWERAIALHHCEQNAYFLNKFKTMRQFAPQSSVLPWMC